MKVARSSRISLTSHCCSRYDHASLRENLIMRTFAFVLASTVFLCTADRAAAWNSVGHMVVAKLAYDQLDAKRQLALSKLLRTHPHYQMFLAAGRPAEIDNEVEWVMLRSA